MKKYLLIITSFAFAFLTNSCTKQNGSLLENEFGNANSTQPNPSLGIDLNKPSVLAFLNKLKISKDQVKYYNEVILPQKIAGNLKYKNPYCIEQIIQKFGIERKDAERVTAEKTMSYNAEIIKRYGSFDNWYKSYKKALEKKDLRFNNARVTTPETLESGPGWGYKVTLLAPDNNIYNLRAESYGYLMDYFDMQGYDFANCDRSGCGSTCVSYLYAGQIDDTEQSFLNDCEREGGWFLPCVTYIQGDISMGGPSEDIFSFWIYLFGCI
jgi:ferredoxin